DAEAIADAQLGQRTARGAAGVERVDAAVEGETVLDPCLRLAAELVRPLQNGDAEAGPCEVGRGGETGYASTDQDSVRLCRCLLPFHCLCLRMDLRAAVRLLSPSRTQRHNAV